MSEVGLNVICRPDLVWRADALRPNQVTACRARCYRTKWPCRLDRISHSCQGGLKLTARTGEIEADISASLIDEHLAALEDHARFIQKEPGKIKRLWKIAS